VNVMDGITVTIGETTTEATFAGDQVLAGAEETLESVGQGFPKFSSFSQWYHFVFGHLMKMTI